MLSDVHHYSKEDVTMLQLHPFRRVAVRISATALGLALTVAPLGATIGLMPGSTTIEIAASNVATEPGTSSWAW